MSREIAGTENPVKPIPLVLVHGFTGTPGIWCNLIQALTGMQVTYEGKDKTWTYSAVSCQGSGPGIYAMKEIWPFDYSDNNTGDPERIAQNLISFINNKRKENGYPEGKIDIVCHSMGALVSRYCMEVLTGSSGETDAEQVRSWIGICPVNHGAAIADIIDNLPCFLHAVFPSFIGFTPAVHAMRTDSEIVRSLKKKPQSSGTIYRVIAGYNSEKTPWYKSLPLCFGKTLEVTVDAEGKRKYAFTYFGDGVVALAQSYLEGAGLDCFEMEEHIPAPCSKKVIETILTFLQNPDTPLLVNWPARNSQKLTFNATEFLKKNQNSDRF
ncbi:MAG: hypothetical protein WC586_03165 [Methanoregula sp.]